MQATDSTNASEHEGNNRHHTEHSSDDSAPAGLGDASELQSRLADAFGAAARKQILVGLSIDGEASYAFIDDATHRTQDAHADMTLVTGCITKLLTAALAAHACDAGSLALDQPVCDLLERVMHVDCLAGVTIKHLLEHTHGLDDSLLDSAPRLCTGFIDVSALCAHLDSVEPLAAPGRLYSYSHVGAWLIAALLERRFGKRYDLLLHERLLAPLGIDSACNPVAHARRSAATLCPSAGGAFAISVSGMLAFIREHGLRNARESPCGDDSACAGITRLPGWHPFERGIRLGWKYYGGGWLGHNSTWPGASALVRAQPRQRIALVVASRDHPASVVAAKLFGKMLHELAALEMPKILSARDAEELDLTRCVGAYCSAAQRVSIIDAGGRALELHASRNDERGSGTALIDKPAFAPNRVTDVSSARSSITVSLRAARDEMFFAAPVTELFPFVQFIAPRAGSFQYVWNGRRVWRRVPATRVQ